MTRPTLRALARSRGYYPLPTERVGPPGLPGWCASANTLRRGDSVFVEAPTRRAAEAGLRACLEAMPER